MLCKRIIPCLDVNQGRVVKGIQFVNLIDAGDPVEVAKQYNKNHADEIVFLDITASHEGRDTILDVVNQTAKEIFIPLTVGGGIRTTEDIKKILRAGADKVAINSSAVKNPHLINEGAKQYGNQCIVVAIDAKRNTEKGSWDVYIHGGRLNTNKDAIAWAKEVQQRGAGEILLTSMDCDGTKNGYDIELTKKVSQAVGIPVIASGGAGTPQHFSDVLTEGYADAALAASLFHFGEIQILELKNYLKNEGITVRP